VNINEYRALQVSLVLRFKFRTDLIINWIYLIKTHSRETWGKSTHNMTVNLSNNGDIINAKCNCVAGAKG
jgi:hypothetical protein